MRAAGAGAVYVCVIFALGFILGVIRTLLIVPRTGELMAVVIELPVMLAASWFVCRAVIHRLGIPPAIPPRAVMGGTAFALLMIAEWLLATLVMGRTAPEIAAHYLEAAGALGLAGQVLFGLFPLLQRS